MVEVRGRSVHGGIAYLTIVQGDGTLAKIPPSQVILDGKMMPLMILQSSRWERHVAEENRTQSAASALRTTKTNHS